MNLRTIELTKRTSFYDVLNSVPSLVSDADVPGDLGFNTPTNDRDVCMADLDGPCA